MLPGCPVPRAKQSSIPTSHKVTESRRALGSGRIDEVSFAASASLGTQDGFFNKTNKAAVLHYLLEDLSSDDLPYPQDALFIQDGMALFRTLIDEPNLWRNMPASPGPNGGEEELHLFYGQLS